MVTADTTGFSLPAYFLLSKKPPMVMVIAPASDATRQAMITDDELITRPLRPAASASGMVNPSTNPMHMFRVKMFFFN